jgi:hypothetical protein
MHTKISGNPESVLTVNHLSVRERVLYSPHFEKLPSCADTDEWHYSAKLNLLARNGGNMATSNAQPEKNKCSKCGEIFDTAEGAREHERNCNGKDRVAGTPAAESREQIKTDMEVEDRFDATDN